uniref:Putative adenylate isopentyneyl transferase protein n=1 Tax=Oryza meyeriana var. granulata TaxID=110450 RepID=D4N3S2_9ORYZ|nr:putative adenylate isopentyneyl transferase protein [Oryza meyeriana var. granulata]
MLVVIVGATESGKTKLSIDIAKAIGGEVVNADKMQMYDGLDITTNKVPLEDRRGIPYHLIGSIPSFAGDFPVSVFRSSTSIIANSIASRAHVPVVVGGSNSLIHGLVVDKFDDSPMDPFGHSQLSYRPTLRYECYFLWVHVNKVVLNGYLVHQVDNMVVVGLDEEVRKYFDKMFVDGHVPYVGLGKATGVPELIEYFTRRNSHVEVINEMKINTQILAQVQLAKINRMFDVWKWPVCALDCTKTIRAYLDGSSKDV